MSASTSSPPAIAPADASPEAARDDSAVAAGLAAESKLVPRELPAWHKSNAAGRSLRPQALHAIEDFACKTLASLPALYSYHCVEHTEQVASTAQVIAQAEGLDAPLCDVLVASAWLHDIGITETYAGHEAASCRMARGLLEQFFDRPEINLIEECIMGTKIPQTARHLVSQILCDADLFYLGTTLFAPWSERLRNEYSHVFNRSYTDAEWAQVNIQFMRSHSYFTRFAREYCGAGYEFNLKILEQG